MTVYPLYGYTKFQQATFDLMETVQYGSTRGGAGQIISSGNAHWRGSYTTGVLQEAEQIAWQAWWQRLRGGVHQFYGVPLQQQYPQLYPGGFSGVDRAQGGAFDGTATVTAVTTTTITLGGLPSYFTVKLGDFLGLEQGAYRGLFRSQGNVTATVGGSMTIIVMPFVKTSVFTTSATANFYRPNCILVPEPDSWSGEPSKEPKAFSFSGLQKVI